uniref:Peptidase S1 domain-containing protein n=1 Tax=Kryptolebias marmoratus TaxID=37003 RepID=A0A3Q3AFZ2_KRYMA
VLYGGPVLNSRIIGGQNASPKKWPWRAAIKYSNRVFCQGSLITNQWVLTAAYCSLSQVSTPMNMKDFNYSSLDNNICLLKLLAPVNFTTYIQPVSLASENTTFYDGIASWVTGFVNFDQPDILQEVEIPIVGNNRCKCLYNDYYYYFLPKIETLICAGKEDGSKNSFYGDDGAALGTKNGSIWIQSGIVSYSFGYIIQTPNVYTRVSQFQKWISHSITGMKPDFVTFTSTGNNIDLNYTCSRPAPTSSMSHTTTVNTSVKSIFNSGKKLIHNTHFFSLFVFVQDQFPRFYQRFEPRLVAGQDIGNQQIQTRKVFRRPPGKDQFCFFFFQLFFSFINIVLMLV